MQTSRQVRNRQSAERSRNGKRQRLGEDEYKRQAAEAERVRRKKKKEEAEMAQAQAELQAEAAPQAQAQAAQAHFGALWCGRCRRPLTIEHPP